MFVGPIYLTPTITRTLLPEDFPLDLAVVTGVPDIQLDGGEGSLPRAMRVYIDGDTGRCQGSEAGL